jgi:shikimate kinase
MIFRRPIVLIGFMATGKSTVGRLIAAQTGRSFIDLDASIVTQAAMQIAEIFRQEGESGFRRRESLALASALTNDFAVIATGGGAACKEENLQAMLNSGFVVALSADPAEVIRRVGPASGRPLLDGSNDPQGAAMRLLAQREPFYARAHARVDTVGRSPEQVAGDVITAFETQKES